MSHSATCCQGPRQLTSGPTICHHLVNRLNCARAQPCSDVWFCPHCREEEPERIGVGGDTMWIQQLCVCVVG